MGNTREEKDLLKTNPRDFPSGSVVKTSCFNTGGASSVPGHGDKIPHDLWLQNQNTRQKQYCKSFNNAFKKSTSKNL